MSGRILTIVFVGALAMACGEPRHADLLGPSPMPANSMPAQPGVFMMVGGWSGTFSDMSGTAMVDWMLTQDGRQLMGHTSWSDGHGYHDDWIFSGVVMSDTDMSFTWESPSGHMIGQMMVSCPLTIRGVGHLVTEASGETSIRGTYSGTSSCTGPINGGQFVLRSMP